MKTAYRFPGSSRLHLSRDFEQVYSSGTRLKAFPLRVRALKRPGSESRLGLSISSRTGKATVRNRWKRAIREAFRLHRHQLVEPHDLVVSISWDASPKDVKRAEEALVRIIEKLNGQAQAAEQGQSP